MKPRESLEKGRRKEFTMNRKEFYEKSRGMCLKTTEYGENEKAFFAANDTDGDGVLDVIDLFNISNMRYGN